MGDRLCRRTPSSRRSGLDQRCAKRAADGWYGLAAALPGRADHSRSGDERDLARVARLVLRQAVGLVLSGGGARAFAHIGVIKAFAEAGIPIDLVAGTSMGAMVAASVALGHQPDVMIEKFLRAFKRNPIADYTVPIIALTRGRRMRRLLMEHCGDALIENTWKNFFLR